MPLYAVWRQIVRAPGPRSVGLVLLAVAGGLLLLNVAEAPPFHLWSFRALLGVPSTITGAALLAAALLAGELSRSGGRRAWWLVAALLLGLIGFEQLGSLHERAELKLGGHETLLAGPVCALGVVLAAVAALLRNPLLALGAGLFALARAVELLTDSVGAANAVGTMEALAVAAALPATLAAVQARPGWGRSHDFDLWRVTRTFVEDSDPRRVAYFLAAVIGALAVGGLLVNVADAPLEFLDMNHEETAPAFASGLFLFAAALLCLLLARLPADEDRSPGWWSLFGWCLLLLGIDEVGAFHESIQEATGVKGQLFLLPLVVALGAAWLVALGRVGRSARLLLVAGAAAWAMSQLLDVLQGTDDEDHPTIVPEEVFELSGSALFLLALLLAAQAASRAGSAGGYSSPRQRSVPVSSSSPSVRT
jgi:hypothetical protein